MTSRADDPDHTEPPTPPQDTPRAWPSSPVPPGRQRGLLQRLRRVPVLRRVDQSRTLLAAVDQVRQRLPGDPNYGDPLSVSGTDAPGILGQQLASLASRSPSALRELGLGALQVWQAYAASRPQAIGEAEQVVLFTDLGRFSSWTLKVGDAEAIELLRTVSAAVEPLFRQHHGELVKRLGDGLMAVFDDAEDAVAAAIAARDEVDRISLAKGKPRLRAGLHRGRPSKLGNDYFGVDVNVAARVAAAAAPGEVLISNSLVERLDPAHHELRRRRRFRAKGVPTEVTVYTVRPAPSPQP
ncbi:MAG: adenylate/guanylate cyclase domain-containing protein [Sciscionella sp.]